jgi:hypothetical protein
LVGNFAVRADDIDALIRKIGDLIAGGEGACEVHNSGTKDVPGRVEHSFPHPPAGTVIKGEEFKNSRDYCRRRYLRVSDGRRLGGQ